MDEEEGVFPKEDKRVMANKDLRKPLSLKRRVGHSEFGKEGHSHLKGFILACD